MTVRPRVLVVDDEPNLRRALTISLRAKGYEVDTASDGASALKAAAIVNPDVMILDLGLPDLDGADVLTALRTWTMLPVLVLSARTGSEDKVRALDAGADDYVTKPFEVQELLARLRALTRRAGLDEPLPLFHIGEFIFDVPHRTITSNSDRGLPHLTKTEWNLLELMLRSPGRLLSREALLRGLGRDPDFTDDSYLRLFIRQLRRKIESDPTRPRHFITEAGVGYRLTL